MWIFDENEDLINLNHVTHVYAERNENTVDVTCDIGNSYWTIKSFKGQHALMNAREFIKKLGSVIEVKEII